MTIEVSKILSGEASMRELVNIEITSALCRGFDYNFDEKRLKRIAEKACELIDESIPAYLAFASALDLDLMLYGDPNEKDGILPLDILPLRKTDV